MWNTQKTPRTVYMKAKKVLVQYNNNYVHFLLVLSWLLRQTVDVYHNEQAHPTVW